MQTAITSDDLHGAAPAGAEDASVWLKLSSRHSSVSSSAQQPQEDSGDRGQADIHLLPLHISDCFRIGSPDRHSVLETAINFGVACLCPCLLLGELKTLKRRETPIKRALKAHLHIGRAGFCTCLKMSTLCISAWPFSPCLSYHLYDQREKLKLIYDHTTPYSTGQDDCCLAAICWPMTLLQIDWFLRQQNTQQMLRFDWEEEPRVMEDLLRPHPSRVDTVKAVIVGGPGTGKSALFTKILGCPQNNQTTVTSAKPQVGVKGLSVSLDHMQFLELWDLPTNSSELSLHLEDAAAVVLTFDCSDDSGGSILYAKELYSSIQMKATHGIRRQTPLKIILAATKFDLINVWRNVDETTESELKRKGLLNASLANTEVWARENGMSLLRTSCIEETEILRLHREILAASAATPSNAGEH